MRLYIVPFTYCFARRAHSSQIRRLCFVWLVDNTLFCHAGVSREFAASHARDANDPETTVADINALGYSEMWDDRSPLWLRPQGLTDEQTEQIMYGAGSLLQVVGHTPVDHVVRCGNVVSCDTFSTYDDGVPIGDCSFAVIDTLTGDGEVVAADAPSAR